MRRILVIILSILLVGSMSGSASAASIKVRTDPNDVPGGVQDIRIVRSDFTDTALYVAVEMGARFFRHGPYILILLDITGTGRFDEVIEVAFYSDSPVGHGWVCFDEDARGGRGGYARALRPNARSLACRLPRAWYPDIHRAVRFVVLSGFEGVDRAPDDGVYRWL